MFVFRPPCKHVNMVFRLNLVCRGRCSVVSHVSCDGNSASYLPLSYLQNESLERLSPEAWSRLRATTYTKEPIVHVHTTSRASTQAMHACTRRFTNAVLATILLSSLYLILLLSLSLLYIFLSVLSSFSLVLSFFSCLSLIRITTFTKSLSCTIDLYIS